MTLDNYVKYKCSNINNLLFKSFQGMSYKLSPKEFISSAMHFLSNYRNPRNLSKDRRNSTNIYEQNSI